MCSRARLSRRSFSTRLMCGNGIALESVAPDFPRAWWKLSRWLRARHYDLIILAYAKEKRLCFASAFSGTSRRIAMWSGIWGRLTLHQCLRSEILTNPRPFAQILLRCAEAVGAPPRGIKPDFFLSENEQADMRKLIPAHWPASHSLAFIPARPATPATCRARSTRNSPRKFCRGRIAALSSPARWRRGSCSRIGPRRFSVPIASGIQWECSICGSSHVSSPI